MANHDIKAGDPKLRAFVESALVEGRAVLEYCEKNKIQDMEYDLVKASVILLEDWQKASSPYHMQHILNFATALRGETINQFKFQREG